MAHWKLAFSKQQVITTVRTECENWAKNLRDAWHLCDESNRWREVSNDASGLGPSPMCWTLRATLPVCLAHLDTLKKEAREVG